MPAGFISSLEREAGCDLPYLANVTIHIDLSISREKNTNHIVETFRRRYPDLVVDCPGRPVKSRRSG